MSARLLAVAAGVLAASPALALDEVTFGTNWLAQAEHGGYYQAVADGTYEEYGLDVTIRPGGPQAPNRQLLMAGQIDFYMGGTLGVLDAVSQGIPLVAVGAIFQKDPQGLLAHADSPVETFADLATMDTIFMAREGFSTYFEWMKANFEGFSDEQFSPYQFNPGPFLADPNSAQQAYLTSEPYKIEQETGWAPKMFLLADAGYRPYASTIEAQSSLVEENPDLVQRFVDATLIGWYNYLYGDNSAANELIKADNPDMTDGQLAFSLEQMKAEGIVDSGDAEAGGIGCMTEGRFQEFFEDMVQIGVLAADLDYTQAYTLDFVCKNVGADLRPS
ncbi:ABC transporter substrate-binding protein [Aureimonas populi]|uniref:ABC transporter substrate-binding protein n=1 Tax=Aureimonas populi TaxID=1701758 RepID=A0ABW5CLH5_9HYPH|nr:ABC transporter substrate-binding protein [Aureimonas populi]